MAFVPFLLADLSAEWLLLLDPIGYAAQLLLRNNKNLITTQRSQIFTSNAA
jgi:hypothetical protein